MSRLPKKGCHYFFAFGLSRATPYRRLGENGVSPDGRTQLSASTLDSIVQSIKSDHPNDGEVLMQGHLHRLNINIRRQDYVHQSTEWMKPICSCGEQTLNAECTLLTIPIQSGT